MSGLKCCRARTRRCKRYRMPTRRARGRRPRNVQAGGFRVRPVARSRSGLHRRRPSCWRRVRHVRVMLTVAPNEGLVLFAPLTIVRSLHDVERLARTGRALWYGRSTENGASEEACRGGCPIRPRRRPIVDGDLLGDAVVDVGVGDVAQGKVTSLPTRGLSGRCRRGEAPRLVSGAARR